MKDIITQISIYSPLLGLVLIYKKPQQEVKLIFLFLAVSMASDLFNQFIRWEGLEFSRELKIQLLITKQRIYPLVEFLVGIVFFYTIFNRTKLIIIAVVLFLSVYFIEFLLLNSYMNSHSYSVASLIFVICSMSLFYKFYMEEEYAFIENVPLLWFNIGFLIYFAGALIPFSFGNLLLEDPSLFKWEFHNLFNITKNILFAIGIWKSRTSV